jgi:cohesin complex subunit SA-1/2
MYLSAASRSEKQFLSLARQLSNHIVIRKGFSIAQRLPSEDLVKLHTDCINYVAGKLATFESQERATSRNRALVMFKGLTLCTAGMSGKEAAAVHAHMDKTFKQYNVLPSTASKHWEPQRAYDKKLVSLMSKDSSESFRVLRAITNSLYISSNQSSCSQASQDRGRSV